MSIFVFFINLLFFNCVYCQPIDNMVENRKPLEFASDMYGGKIGAKLQLVLLGYENVEGEVILKRNNKKITNLQNHKDLTKIVVVRREFDFVIIIKAVEAESAGLYSVEYEGEEPDGTKYSARPFTIVVVLVDPICSASLVDIVNDKSTPITSESILYEGQMLMLKCNTSFYSDANLVQPFQGWKGITSRRIKKALNDKKEQLKPDLFHFTNNHETNLTLSFNTELKSISCVTELMQDDENRGPPFGYNFPKKNYKKALSKVVCNIPDPKLYFCPLHVRVEETKLPNGSRELKCEAKGNPAPVYVWQSTHTDFQPVISDKIVVDLPGYYTCTARNSMRSYDLNCHPQIAVHGISVFNSDRPSTVFIVIMSVSALFGGIGIVFLFVGKNQIDNKVAPTTIRSFFGVK